MATRLPANQAAFTLDELLAATGGVLAARGEAEGTTCVSTNTRELQHGAAFVALRGQVHDAHAFVADAAAAGAPLAIVEREVEAPREMTVVRVPSTLRALADLARAHVARWHGLGGRTVVGITGSAGKTTTRVAAAAIVHRLFPGQTVATRGNLNNRIGVPMMLFSLRHEHRVAVLELGTSEPGEIAELCRMAQPDVGILTLIAPAHLDGLGSIDGVAREKGDLYRALPRGGIAVGNGDDARVRELLDGAEVARHVSYGWSPDAGLRLEDRTPLGMTHSRVAVVRRDGRRSMFDTPLVGEAGALACAAAIAAIEAACGVELEGEWLTAAFREVDVGEGAQRLVPHELASGLALIDDTYNANPASMAASIRAAAEMAEVMGRRLVLVLGEMRELGGEAAAGHDRVGQLAAESGARLVVAVGGGQAWRMAKAAGDAGLDVLSLPSVDEALPAIAGAVLDSDLVLVKSSRSVGTDRIVVALTRQRDVLAR